jgi:hypothetical protein
MRQEGNFIHGQTKETDVGNSDGYKKFQRNVDGKQGSTKLWWIFVF